MANKQISGADTISGNEIKRDLATERNDARKKKARMEVTEVDVDPPSRRYLLYDQARRLATMPRQRYDEFTQSAFWAAIATAPSGIAGFVDLLSDKPNLPKLLDIIQILIFAICVALTIVGCRKFWRIETATDYLKDLFPPPENASEK